MASGRRDQLLEVALALFCRDGFHATGIDRILAESGVAKATLYNHFQSKEELIRAALRRADERVRNRFMRQVERQAPTAAGRLLAIFDVLEKQLAERDFRGCPFIKAAAEYASPDDPIHVAAAESKRLLRAYIRDLAAAAGAVAPGRVAQQLALLMEGATVLTQLSGGPGAARDSRETAEILLRQAIPEWDRLARP